jgi:hypothetical protein
MLRRKARCIPKGRNMYEDMYAYSEANVIIREEGGRFV